jgi:hypothetical protein
VSESATDLGFSLDEIADFYQRRGVWYARYWYRGSRYVACLRTKAFTEAVERLKERFAQADAACAREPHTESVQPQRLRTAS